MPRGLTALALVACTAMPANAQDAPAGDADQPGFFYMYGYQIGSTLTQNGLLEMDGDAIMNGMRDAFDRVDPPFTSSELFEAAREEFARQRPAWTAAFLERNAAQDGVTVTESGLQYRVEERGEGANPTPDNRVTVHYVGRLLTGGVFDSSKNRGEPATFGVTEVIPGWAEALQLMKPGAKWEVWMPPELAYGQASGNPTIPPGSGLNFTIELIDIAE